MEGPTIDASAQPWPVLVVDAILVDLLTMLVMSPIVAGMALAALGRTRCDSSLARRW